MRSTNGGEHWERIPVPSKYSLSWFQMNAKKLARRVDWVGDLFKGLGIDTSGNFQFPVLFVMSPDWSTDRTLFVANFPSGLLRSEDGGSSYTTIWDSNGKRIQSLVLSPDYSEDTTLFVALEEGVYRSKDGGEQWRLLDTPVEFGNSMLAVSPQFSTDATLFRGKPIRSCIAAAMAAPTGSHSLSTTTPSSNLRHWRSPPTLPMTVRCCYRQEGGHYCAVMIPSRTTQI